MSIRDDFKTYFDGNGLLCPNPTDPKTIRGSDNGCCFLSEYCIMLKKQRSLTDKDVLDYQNKIGQCINPEGMLCRVPVDQYSGQEQVDNYYSVLNGCMQLGNTEIPRKFLKALIINLGFLDNINPGSHSNWASFMPRQPQLVAAMIAASFPSWKNPLHVILRAFCAPLFVLASISIGISCIGVPTSDTDARRLSWHLMQNTRKVSMFCWISSKIWLRRLYRDYGAKGMAGVAEIYYQPQPNNPYSKYWITD